jgi:hypothetical protein
MRAMHLAFVANIWTLWISSILFKNHVGAILIDLLNEETNTLNAHLPVMEGRGHKHPMFPLPLPPHEKHFP